MQHSLAAALDIALSVPTDSKIKDQCNKAGCHESLN